MHVWWPLQVFNVVSLSLVGRAHSHASNSLTRMAMGFVEMLEETAHLRSSGSRADTLYSSTISLFTASAWATGRPSARIMFT